jgi:feruloyl esterase
MNAPWYIGGTTQASVIGGDSAGYWISYMTNQGFHNPRLDALLALVNRVETGTAPTEMIATKWNDEDTLDSVTRQRPICMYPQQAKYVGHDDPDIASSWECRSGY